MTEVIFILDRSGSMAGLEADTIGGFNSTIRKQQQTPGDVLVSTVLFDNASEVIHDRLPLEQVPPMTEEDYSVHGCTALLDAVGDAIRHIRNVHKYARKEDVPEKTIFFITTDGMENASRNYDYPQVKELIQQQTEKYGWEFVFFGANIDVEQEAQRMGIKKKNAVAYTANPAGIRRQHDCFDDILSMFREKQ